MLQRSVDKFLVLGTGLVPALYLARRFYRSAFESRSSVASRVPRVAGVEGGGTTWRVAICEGNVGNIVEQAEFPTEDPKTTLDHVISWLSSRHFDAIGVACFGPIDLDPSSKTYGYITSTPKKQWQHVDVLSPFRRFQKPLMFDTDVNAPAFAEHRHGGHGNISSCVYITVGTGIGVGVVVNNAPVHGLVHPEGGHILVQKYPLDQESGFPGTCPFHVGCVEGMASAGAAASRKGLSSASKLASLEDTDPLWDAEAHYLSSLCATLVLTMSPEVIVVGGGVMKRRCLVGKIQAKTRELLGGYVASDKLSQDNMKDYIKLSRFGDEAGLIGSVALGFEALNKK